eukprot:g3047.t1
MEQYRTLVSKRNNKNNSPSASKKDKLGQTKKRNAEIKAALKEVRDNKKQEKHEEKAAAAQLQKLERLQEHPDSKRAQKDARHMERRDRHKSGEMCEHGIWKCKICFPHSTGK